MAEDEAAMMANVERTRRHLEHAYERDLPITLTRYADPQLLGRMPVRLSEVLPLVFAQQRANRLQQQQEKHDHGVIPEDAEFVPDDEDADAQGDGGVHPPAHSTGCSSGCGGGFIGKRNTLPEGVWRALCEAATSEQFSAVFASKEDIASLAAGARLVDRDGDDGSHDCEGRAGDRKAGPDSSLKSSVASLAYRKEVVWDYLMRPRTSPPPPSHSHHGNNANGGQLSSTAPPSLVPAAAASAARRGAPSSEHAPSDYRARDGALLYGVRAIPSNSPEFFEVLASWLEKLDEAEAEEEEEDTEEGDGTAAAPPNVPLTAQQRHVMAALLSAGQVRSHTLHKAARQQLTVVEASSLARLGSYTYHPTVKSSASDVLDALVPPRLLLFFDIDEQVLSRHFSRIRHQLKLIKQLEGELAALRGSPSGDGERPFAKESESGYNGASNSSSSKVKLLERQLQAAYAVYRGQGSATAAGGADGSPCGNRNFINPVVGEALLMIETASVQQSTRQEMLALEAELDHYLEVTRARCQGQHPLHSPAYQRPQLQQSQGSAMDGVAATSALVPRPPAPRGTHSATASAATASMKKSVGRSTAERPASSTVPQPQLRSHSGSNGGAESTRNASSAPRGSLGCTASVMTSLGGAPLELSHERTVIQFHLLKQELLRQVAVDLPERGVLLARVLNEAQLAVESYAVLVNTASVAAQQHRSLDGVEALSAEANAKEAALSTELAELKTRKAALLERKASLTTWAKQRRAADTAAAERRVAFEEAVAERLRSHTEAIKAQQDRERRGSTVA